MVWDPIDNKLGTKKGPNGPNSQRLQFGQCQGGGQLFKGKTRPLVDA